LLLVSVVVVDHPSLRAVAIVLDLQPDLPVVVVVLGHLHGQVDRPARAELHLRVAMVSHIAPMETFRLLAVVVAQAVRVPLDRVAQAAVVELELQVP
jgi:hypothetical protein